MKDVKSLHYWKQGDRIMAARLEDIRKILIQSLSGGRGINVKTFGNKILITRTDI